MYKICLAGHFCPKDNFTCQRSWKSCCKVIMFCRLDFIQDFYTYVDYCQSKEPTVGLPFCLFQKLEQIRIVSALVQTHCPQSKLNCPFFGYFCKINGCHLRQCLCHRLNFTKFFDPIVRTGPLFLEAPTLLKNWGPPFFFNSN